MFHWCQNVNVFNIENHYHFYNERTINSANRVQVSYDKLKPGPISLTTSSNLGRSSKSCFKKGLNLSKKLNKQQNPQPNNKLQQIQYSSIQQPKILNTKQHTISITISQADMAKTKSMQSQHSSKQILKPSINPIINAPLHKQQNIIKIYPNTTHIDIDRDSNNNSILLTTGNKNNIQNNIQIRNYSHAHTYSYKQQNNLLLTQLYSTQKSSNNQTIINNTNNNINLNTTLNTNPNHNLNINPNINVNIKPSNYNNIETIPIRSSNKDQLLDLTTSRNLYSRQRSQRQITTSDKYQDMRIQQQNQIQRYQRDSRIQDRDSLSRSSRGYNNSKYNISKSMSASVNYSSTKNQGYFLRVMEMSRGQARQASIILSNILSRGSQNCYSSSHNYINLKQQIKTFNFQDKLTILSQQNDALSQRQSQLKVQQSQLYDMDPCSNFTIIQNKQIISDIYRVDLAIQNYTQCIVSLKQIGFRQMKIISQQLQMYQFIQQKLINTDSSRHILQLYQFQTTSSSYILIKQPYTQNLISYFFNLSKQSRNIFITQFQNMLKILLHQFGNQLMFPCRQFTILDFVICDSVIKLQDLSVFKQMKKQMFVEQQLLKITQLNNINVNLNVNVNENVNRYGYEYQQNQQIQINNI